MTEEFFGEVIAGDSKSVKTIGIITAENPGMTTENPGGKLTKIGNERKNELLQKDLEKHGFAPIQMQGKFAGVQERPFLLLNVNKEKLISLAKKYKQQSVIYAEKVKNRFDFMLIQNGRVIKRGKLSLEQPKNQNDNDCYFKLSGKKFTIRFR